MNLLMIAVIRQGKRLIGFRIMDTESKDGKFMNVPADNVREVIEGRKAHIVNLGVVDGKVVGTNGVLDRYPVINANGKLLSKRSPLIVVNQLEDAGYTVVDYKGTLKKVRTKSVVEYAKVHGIANGKVVSKDNIEFISSIVGSYPIQKIEEARISGTQEEAAAAYIKITQNKDNRTIAKNARAEVEFEIDEGDVFLVFTDTQKEVIKDYYMWYTVDKYNSLAKSIRFKLSPSKAEALAKLRGIQDWEFGGAWDTGFMGGAKCSLGHDLRYVFYAVPSDDRHNEDARLAFGRNCAADFFSIDPEDMKVLIKTADTMTEEIRLLSDIIANKQESAYILKTELLYRILAKLGSVDNIHNAFGKKVGNTLVRFMVAKLPFPMSLVIEASKVASSDMKRFYSLVFPEYEEYMDELLKRDFESNTMRAVREYLEFMASNKIEGDYAYNPLDKTVKRTDVGRYNKSTRNARHRLLYTFRSTIFCNDFSMEELEALMYSTCRMLEYRRKIEDYFEGSDLFKDKEDLTWGGYTWANEKDIDSDERNRRAIISNSLITDWDYELRYRYTSWNIYDSSRMRNEVPKTIYTIQNSLREVEGKFDELLVRFEKFRRERIEEMREREEQARLKRMEQERERQEQERKRREQERLERQRKEKEKAEKIKRISGDNVDVLRELFKMYPNMPLDSGIRTAMAIVDRKTPYERLSPRQQWRVDKTIEIYEDYWDIEVKRDEDTSKNTGRKEEDKNKAKRVVNRTYMLDEHPEIEKKVQLVIDNKDSDKMEKVYEKSRIALKVAYTIMRNRKASDRQMKHIDIAVDILGRD